LEQVGRDPTDPATGVHADEVSEMQSTSEDESGIEDDRLRLIFTCCHPALALESRVALTLRALAGLSTAEVARAFLVPEATMAKRRAAGLMLFQHSRRTAHVGEDGELVTLEDQDRSLWDRTQSGEAEVVLRAALRHRRPGPYQLQAAIAGLYELLLERVPSPVVRLNRAVAVAMADGLDAGLQLVEELAADGSLEDYHLLEATRAGRHPTERQPDRRRHHSVSLKSWFSTDWPNRFSRRHTGCSRRLTVTRSRSMTCAEQSVAPQATGRRKRCLGACMPRATSEHRTISLPARALRRRP
jgi:predicted RNA polymerase sigma factor